MENQVENLIKKNIPSCYLNSNISAKKYEENYQLIEKGKKTGYITYDGISAILFLLMVKSKVFLPILAAILEASQPA